MTPIVHLILLVFAFCCFVLDAYQNPPAPTRITCIGLACLVASMLSW